MKIHPAFLASTYLPGKPTLFLLESNKTVLEFLKRTVGKQYAVHAFTDARCFLERLAAEASPGVVVLSWEGAEVSLPIFSELRSTHSEVPIVILTCRNQVSDYQHFVRLGATEVLLKPLAKGDLEMVLGKLLPSLKMDSNHAAEIPLDDERSFVRSSKRMREIEGQAKLVASSDIPVLILGESGTGKEVLAMYTHKMSRRAKKMFMKINCAAMPAELLESELFGYEQGAFTGAAKMKPGKFEACDGGTIFLDEIGEMPAILQAKLLQVLQDGTFSRLGGRTSMRVDVRIIAATNVNMKQAMAEKSFREDLYYRLNGISLMLPPLRERTEEIPSLVSYFMRKGAAKYGLRPMAVSAELMTLFTEFSWPGNLRELENIINRLLVMQDEKSIIAEVTTRTLPTSSADRMALAGNATQLGGLKDMVRDLKGEAESVAIIQVLEAKGWNRRAAALSLQISYKALLYKIKQYNLAPSSMQMRGYRLDVGGQALRA